MLNIGKIASEFFKHSGQRELDSLKAIVEKIHEW